LRPTPPMPCGYNNRSRARAWRLSPRAQGKTAK
jgi:hypothetical protein